MIIPLSSPSITDLERRYVADAINSGWISAAGEYVTRFEQMLAGRIGRKHAIAMTNGTVALEAALLALGIGAGDEVIVPALTFVAPAAAVRSVGALPVFAEVYGNTWNISAGDVARMITPRTKAVIAVDVMGHSCNYKALQSVVGNIPIIEDAAEAHGAKYQGAYAGSFGVVSTLSFHANKSISTGEGGALLTDDDDIAQQVRLLMNHGMTRERPYWHDVVGHNWRMTNLTAAIGCAQLERWDELIAARQQVADWYDDALGYLFRETQLWRRPLAADCDEACWLYTLHHQDRGRILNALHTVGIDARAIWPALCDLPLYVESCRQDCVSARHISNGAFWLPTSATMTQSDVEQVAEVLCAAFV